MPYRKKRKFVVRPLNKKKRREHEQAYALDPFYFDPATWARLEQIALDHRQPARMSRQHVAKRLKAWRDNRRRRQRAAVDRRREDQKAKTRAAFHGARSGPALRDRILVAMAPDTWLASVDIATSIGATRRSVGAILAQVLAPAGLICEAPNPDPTKAASGANRDPEKLWTLTAAGLIERAEVLPSVLAGKRHKKRPATVSRRPA